MPATRAMPFIAARPVPSRSPTTGTFGKKTDHDLKAIYDYLSAILSLPDNPNPGRKQRSIVAPVSEYARRGRPHQACHLFDVKMPPIARPSLT